MKVKNYSKVFKAALVLLGLACSFLKWFNIMPNATIGEIWAAMGMAYGIGLGSIDFNIIRDTWVGR